MSLSHLEVPRFPRGFLLSERPVNPPPTFVPGPILDNFYVHPWANVETAGDARLFVIVVGHLVPTRPAYGPDPATVLLAALHEGESQFLSALGDYSGRHAILFGSVDNIRVVNDATAMRSVFYAAKGGVVASHALLVEKALGGEPSKDDLVFAYGYPGNRTPYSRTRILTANTYYWMTANLVRRFWPIVALPSRGVDEVAEDILESASAALQHMSQDRAVKMALTAGLDSRAILAVGLYAGIDFDTYTYGVNKATALDRSFAPDLASHVGVSHELVEHHETSDELKDELSSVHYSPHHRGAVSGLTRFFGDPETVAVSGNLLEIGRSFYLRFRNTVAAPVSADTMAQLHARSTSRDVQNSIEEYGRQQYFAVADAAFQEFIDSTGYNIIDSLLDPFDLFYWEHRMSTWHGPAMAERDFYGVAFIPFNSRRIFEATLSVSQEHRNDSSVFYRLIEKVDPRLLELPVNPKKWGPATARKFRRRLPVS